MKRFIAMFLTVLTVLTLYACSSKDYNQSKAYFEKDGVTLTLTKAFSETDIYPYAEAFAAYSSDKATVAVFKIEFGENGKISARDYADRWAVSNLKFAPEPIKEEKGIVNTCYKAEYNGEAHMFYTAFYATAEAIWIVQFFCPENAYEEYSPYFVKWAGSVKFDNE